MPMKICPCWTTSLNSQPSLRWIDKIDLLSIIEQFLFLNSKIMSTARILIVEDSFIVAYHLQTTLESEGHIVVGKCDSGEKAIELAETLHPDLVLMDIMINGKMDGIATAFFLKKQYNIPIVYITALTDKDTISRAKITE